MRTVRASSSGLALDEVPEPVPGPGQVLVAPLVCGVCGFDLHIADELRRRGDSETTLMLGHEFCAKILGYGPRTEHRYPVGARVVSMPLLSTGEGDEAIGISANIPGAFSDRMLLDEDRLLPVPEHVPTEQAALVEPLAVGLRAVDVAQAEEGDVALVLGCGPVGCAVIAGLVDAGIAVAASDPSRSRRKLAETLGAAAVVDPDVESPFARWRALGAQDLPYSPALSPDVRRSNAVIFECVGMPGMLQHVIEQAPGHARIVCVGVCMQPDTITPAVAISRELTIGFAFAYRPEEFARALEMIASGRVAADAFVSAVVALDDFDEAIEQLRQPDQHVKVLIRP